MSNDAFELKSCRLCKSTKLKVVIDLGFSPTPNNLLRKKDLNKVEPIFPLKVNFCASCNNLQLSHVVSPKLMFQNYPYVSSTSTVMVDHFKKYAESTFKNLSLKKNDLVVEIGSNDGILLKFYKKLGAKILGVDPAKNIAKKANKEGVLTLADFFSTKIANKISKEYGFAKIISANNVFAHINDLDDVTNGVCKLLDKNGVFIIEFPYVVNLIKDNVFDSIYHEHLSYLAVRPLVKFFKRFNMQIFDVKATNVQGGSIMVFVKKAEGKFFIRKSVKKFINLELAKKINKPETFFRFAKIINKTKESVRSILSKIKTQGKNIAGYGAPGRSTTLLNYFGINTNFLDYIVDDNPNKQGLYTPGTHIPIFSPKKIIISKPDYLLLLSWNFIDPILKKLSEFKKNGGKFIIPIPTPHII